MKIFLVRHGESRLNVDAVSGILAGYEQERRLTCWEKSHIYEAVMFGAFKNAIWSLSHEEVDWTCGEFKIVKTLMRYDRTSFDKDR